MDDEEVKQIYEKYGLGYNKEIPIWKGKTPTVWMCTKFGPDPLAKLFEEKKKAEVISLDSWKKQRQKTK